MPSAAPKSAVTEVWVSYPLKQGLKQINNVLDLHEKIVWVSYPLKQGLKRICLYDKFFGSLGFESAIH